MFPVLLLLLGNHKVLRISVPGTRGRDQQILYYLTDVLSNKLPRGQLASNPAGEAGEYIRTRISGDPHLGKGAEVFISQSLVLLPKDLNYLVFPACEEPLVSRESLQPQNQVGQWSQAGVHGNWGILSGH